MYFLCRLRWSAVEFFFVHVSISKIEHLVERFAVDPFRRADTEAYRKVIQVARLIPLLQGILNPTYYGRCTGCVGVRQCNQEFVLRT